MARRVGRLISKSIEILQYTSEHREFNTPVWVIGVDSRDSLMGLDREPAPVYRRLKCSVPIQRL